MLKIERKSANEITLSGRFDASQVAVAEETLRTLTNSTKVDMSELDYISSGGLGALVATQQHLREKGAGLTLTNLNGHIRDIFRISGLDQLFEIV